MCVHVAHGSLKQCSFDSARIQSATGVISHGAARGSYCDRRVQYISSTSRLRRGALADGQPKSWKVSDKSGKERLCGD